MLAADEDAATTPKALALRVLALPGGAFATAAHGVWAIAPARSGYAKTRPGVRRAPIDSVHHSKSSMLPSTVVHFVVESASGPSVDSLNALPGGLPSAPA